MDTGDIPLIKALVVVDSDGTRIISRYYNANLPTLAEEHAFEKKLFDKTKTTNAKAEPEITMFDNMVVIYRHSCDVWFYVVGSQAENELILVNALSALYDALSSVLHTTPDKQSLLERFDMLLLAIEELVDGGMILEMDPSAIANRIRMKGSEGTETEVADGDAVAGQSWATLFLAKREAPPGWG